MSAPAKYSETRVIHPREMEARPGRPSEILSTIEADLIGRLARAVALAGQRFDGWPSVELVSEYNTLYLRDQWTLRATVATK